MFIVEVLEQYFCYFPDACRALAPSQSSLWAAMFSLSELVPLNQHQNRSKLLKPWWEVFMDYLVVLMLMASVLACTEQLSRDQLVCIPLDPATKLQTPVPHNITPDALPAAQGRRTHMVYQQYVYISQVL